MPLSPYALRLAYQTVSPRVTGLLLENGRKQFSPPRCSVDYSYVSLRCFLLFSNAVRAQRWYLAGTLRVETISRLSGSLLTSKLISAYTQGRIGRNAKLGYNSGFLESVKDARFPYSPKAHTIIALLFSIY